MIATTTKIRLLALLTIVILGWTHIEKTHGHDDAVQGEETTNSKRSMHSKAERTLSGASAAAATTTTMRARRRIQLQEATFQPKITVVEGLPARRSYALLVAPNGSPWCGGKPAFWPIGHQFRDETPWCKQTSDASNNSSNTTTTSGAWVKEYRAIVNWTDDLNAADPDPTNSTGIDRHGCTFFSIPNKNMGRPYLACVVGANDGNGRGYAELYETQSGGSLRKIPTHGLQKYPTMRTKFVVKLNGPLGEKNIFVSVRGGPRDDGGYNKHAMFRAFTFFDFPYFEQVPFPYYQNWRCECAHVADINDDGLDDLILCSAGGSLLEAQIFLQLPAFGGWQPLHEPPNLLHEEVAENLRGWQNVRVGNLLGGSEKDIVVVGYRKSKREGTINYFLRVFEGIPVPPYFDFSAPAFHLDLDHEAPDVEILQVHHHDNDSATTTTRPDLYVVQTNTTDPSGYCGYRDGKFNSPKHFWGGRFNPPKDWIPPADTASDLLLLGTGKREQYFTKVRMRHSYPGCGSRVTRFGNGHTMFLAQSDSKRPGYSLLLEW